VALAEPVRRFFALSLGLAMVLVAASAGAFCRTTTCDSKHEICARENGCIVDGHPLHWREKCLSFGAQEDGSPLRGISYATADQVFRAAFSAWTHANCGGKPPSFRIWDLGPIVCAEPEFNDLLPNANVWIFRDHDWPYEHESETLALTTVLFEKSTGVILDADVEINSLQVDLSTSEVNVRKDLQAIATHEAGHFLGLSHTNVTHATMSAEYVRGDLDYRSLHEDDIAGICAIYPPDREGSDCRSPHPAHGFSRYCGGGKPDPGVSACSFRVAEKGMPGSRALALFMAAIAGFGLHRRRPERSGRH
jgi:MYXO-CTERM domain-containing protein